MKAAIFVGPEQPLAIEDVTPNPPGPRDVVVRVAASGVCHSDLSIVHGYVPLPPPCVLGHEGAGTVESVGADVRKVQPGDRVIASFVPACGQCWYCMHEKTNLCENMFAASMTPRVTLADGRIASCMTGLGTFAEAMTIDETSVVKVDTDLPDEQLALIGCAVTTGVGAALNTARVEPGSSVAVIGCGGVGNAVIQGARIAGAARIFAIDPVELKRKTAEQLGATDLVDPADGDPVAQVQAATGGRGTDYAFEVIGLPETIVQAYNTARRGGTVVVVGMPRMDAQVTLPGWQLFSDEKRLLGCVYGSAQVQRAFPRFIGLVHSGRRDLGTMAACWVALDGANGVVRG